MGVAEVVFFLASDKESQFPVQRPFCLLGDLIVSVISIETAYLTVVEEGLYALPELQGAAKQLLFNKEIKHEEIHF
jgi:hypothetical protein